MSKGGLVYHGALAPLSDALGKISGDVRLVANLLDSGSIRNPFLRKVVILIRHIGFAIGVLARPASPSFFVREFSNIPMMLAFPFVRHARGRMHFLVHHNMQWTVGNRLERMAFEKLGKWGCRFVFLEQIPEHIRMSSPSVLTHPVPVTPYRRDDARRLTTIGVIGQYRPEKGMDELLGSLEPLAGEHAIVLALPNPAMFLKNSRFSKAEWLSMRDTSDFGDYLKTIAECDAIVLNHPAEAYEYRASGLVADAAAARVPVVVRNLPLLANQVQEPSCIGETFEQLSEIPECIRRVADALAIGSYDFDTYRKARSGQALERQLAEMVRR